MSRLRRALPWFWTGFVAVGSVVAGLVADVGGIAELVSGVFFSAVSVLLCALGALVTTRQPGNRIAWILMVVGTGGAANLVLPTSVAEQASHWNALGDYLTSNVGLSMIIFPLLLLLFVFPTGTFTSRRWAWLPAGVGLAAAISLIVGLFDEGTWEPLPSPFGVLPAAVFDVAFGVFFAGLVTMAPAGGASMMVRFRSSSTVVQAQIKWVLLALLVYAISFIAIVAGVASGTEWFALLFIGPIVLLAIAVTIAITRYKLFEIDRIISRSVSYVVVAGLLALLFAAGVTWIPSALGLDNDPLLVAGSTLAVAALFNPLRKRVQTAVDRRFNRSRYEAQLVSDEFANRLRGSLTVEELAEAWTETVDQHLQPQASGVWLREDSK